jgi:hypothetical protein
VTAALTAMTASAALALLTPPTRRYLVWAGPACVALLLSSSGLILLTSALMLTGDWTTAVVTGTIATSILFPALWLARSPAEPPYAFDDDADDDDSGGGGGGPPTPPHDPEPGPPAPELDWDAFNEARDSWAPRERELVGV